MQGSSVLIEVLQEGVLRRKLIPFLLPEGACRLTFTCVEARSAVNAYRELEWTQLRRNALERLSPWHSDDWYRQQGIDPSNRPWVGPSYQLVPRLTGPVPTGCGTGGSGPSGYEPPVLPSSPQE